MESVKVSIDLV